MQSTQPNPNLTGPVPKKIVNPVAKIKPPQPIQKSEENPYDNNSITNNPPVKTSTNPPPIKNIPKVGIGSVAPVNVNIYNKPISQIFLKYLINQ